MVLLTEEEQVVLRDMLDMNVEQFEHAMHADVEESFDSWEALLQTTSGYGDTLNILRGIREKVNDDIAGRGAVSPS
jgi:hypothetical protein